MNSNMKVARAAKKAEIAEGQYTEYVNLIVRTGDDWDFDVLEDLRDRANAADAELLQARHDALNECTCKPDLPDGRCFPLCPVCKADIDRRYGSGIPYEFGGQP